MSHPALVLESVTVDDIEAAVARLVARLRRQTLEGAAVGSIQGEVQDPAGTERWVLTLDIP